MNHYKVLGVPRDARTRDIKKAYRDAALKYHPDKIAPDVSDSERERLTAKFQEIAAAYEILSDEETRAKYDAGEDVSGSGQQSQFPLPGLPRGLPRRRLPAGASPALPRFPARRGTTRASSPAVDPRGRGRYGAEGRSSPVSGLYHAGPWRPATTLTVATTSRARRLCAAREYYRLMSNF